MSIYSGSVRIPVEVLQALSEHTGIFWSSWEMEPAPLASPAMVLPAPPQINEGKRHKGSKDSKGSKRHGRRARRAKKHQ